MAETWYKLTTRPLNLFTNFWNTILVEQRMTSNEYSWLFIDYYYFVIEYLRN